MNEEVKYIIVLLYIIIGMVVYGHYYKEAAERDKTVEELRKTTDAWLAVIYSIYYPPSVHKDLLRQDNIPLHLPDQ